MVRTRVGYAGGKKERPTYHDLGDHTESYQVDYDPGQTSYAKLLEVFCLTPSLRSQSWSRQYRGAIFYADAEQRKIAKEVLQKHPGLHVDLEPLGTFTRAEDYHQKYYLQQSALRKEVFGLFSSPTEFTDSTVAARLNGWVGGHGSPAQIQQALPELGLSTGGQQTLAKLAGVPAAGCSAK